MSEKAPGSSGDLVALNQRRQATIDRLCAHFAEDHLDTAELERLIDRAHHAITVAELDTLVMNLPALGSKTSVAPGRPAPTPIPGGGETLLAVMGGVERSGTWSIGQRLRVFTLMGGASLDFRDATLTAPVTEVELFILMGGVEILVPPGVRIVCDAFSLMGGVEHRTDPTAGVPAPDGPILRITGYVMMGGVEIAERLPGESAKDARRRRRNRGKPTR